MHIRHFCGNRGDILLVLITYDVNTENDVKALENEIINRPFEMYNSFLFQVAIYRYKNGFGGIILKINQV